MLELRGVDDARRRRCSKGRSPPTCASATPVTRQRRLGRVQRAVLRAARRRPGGGRADLPNRRRALAPLPLPRSATSPPCSRSSGSCCCASGSRIAAVVAGAAALLPPLTTHASFPLTDSWGLALEITALAAAVLAFDRGLGWLPLWIGAIALLAFTRDSSWIPILAVGWCALRYRSRVPVTLFATGIAAALPALLIFSTPGARPARAARQRLRAVRRHVLGLHRSATTRARSSSSCARTSASCGAASGTRRSILVGGVLALLLLVWRRRDTPLGSVDADDRGVRVRRSAMSSQHPCSAPSGSSSSSCRWPRTASRSRRGSVGTRRRLGPRAALEPRAWIGRPERRPLSGRCDRDKAAARRCGHASSGTHIGSGAGFRPGSARARAVAVSSRSSSSAARAQRPATRRSSIGEWSAPFAWPIVAVHMSLEPTGQVFALDGFAAGAELRAPLGSRDRALHPGPVRAQPLLRRPHPAAGRPHAPRRRPHQRLRRPRRHDDLQPGDADVLPRPGHGVGRWYPTATQLPDGRVLDVRRRQSSR